MSQSDGLETVVSKTEFPCPRCNRNLLHKYREDYKVIFVCTNKDCNISSVILTTVVKTMSPENLSTEAI